MTRVRYQVVFPNDDRPVVVAADTRAVLADGYELCDIGQGGITFEEVSPGDVQQLAAFPPGSELFVESPVAGDVLDDSTEDTERATRIWWRLVVLGRGTP